jgi:hypothetical protein
MSQPVPAQAELEPMQNCTKVLHFKHYLRVRKDDGQIKTQVIYIHGLWHPKEGVQVCRKTAAFGYLPRGRLHYMGEGYYTVV